MNPSSAHSYGLELLAPFLGEDEARAVLAVLFEDKYNVKPRELNRLDTNIDDKVFESDLNRLLSGEPVQHVVGFQYFMGLKIGVNSNVLIPRPETEELMHWVIEEEKHQPHEVIADICTGSGCIALALYQQFPLSRIFATDLSESALTVARSNENDVFQSSKIEFKKHDVIFEEWQEMMPTLIVSNPPYIIESESESMDRGVMDFEPHMALFAKGDDPLVFYKRIVQQFLNSNSVIYFELNPITAAELKQYVEDLGFACELKKDMFGKTRFAKLRA